MLLSCLLLHASATAAQSADVSLPQLFASISKLEATLQDSVLEGTAYSGGRRVSTQDLTEALDAKAAAEHFKTLLGNELTKDNMKPIPGYQFIVFTSSERKVLAHGVHLGLEHEYALESGNLLQYTHECGGHTSVAELDPDTPTPQVLSWASESKSVTCAALTLYDPTIWDMSVKEAWTHGGHEGEIDDNWNLVKMEEVGGMVSMMNFEYLYKQVMGEGSLKWPGLKWLCKQRPDGSVVKGSCSEDMSSFYTPWGFEFFQWAAKTTHLTPTEIKDLLDIEDDDVWQKNKELFACKGCGASVLESRQQQEWKVRQAWFKRLLKFNPYGETGGSGKPAAQWKYDNANMGLVAATLEKIYHKECIQETGPKPPRCKGSIPEQEYFGYGDVVQKLILGPLKMDDCHFGKFTDSLESMPQDKQRLHTKSANHVMGFYLMQNPDNPCTKEHACEEGKLPAKLLPHDRYPRENAEPVTAPAFDMHCSLKSGVKYFQAWMRKLQGKAFYKGESIMPPPDFNMDDPFTSDMQGPTFRMIPGLKNGLQHLKVMDSISSKRAYRRGMMQESYHYSDTPEQTLFRAVHHWGNHDGYRNEFIVLPELDIGVVFSTNTLGDYMPPTWITSKYASKIHNIVGNAFVQAVIINSGSTMEGEQIATDKKDGEPREMDGDNHCADQITSVKT